MKIVNNYFFNKIPKTRPIVFLHAHADDESFLSAGLINKFIINSYKIILIYLAASLVNGEEKTIIRQKELRDAARVIGIKNIFYLNYCEPKYTSGKPLYIQKIEDVANDILEVLRKENIFDFELFSYDKNGGYGNNDHVIVHKIGRYIFENTKSLQNLYEITIPREKYLKWIDLNKGKLSNAYLPKLEYWTKEFGLRSNEIDYIFKLSESQLNLKRNALIKHKSQIKLDEFPLILNRHDFTLLFGSEYFVKIDKNITS